MRGGWTAGLLAAAMLCLLVPVTKGAIVTMYLYTQYNSELDYDKVIGGDGDPLSDGSYVMVLGNNTGVRDPLVTFGGTNLMSEVENDILLGTFTMNTWGTDGGWIDAGPFFFDSADVKYVYLYFFDTHSFPVEGVTPWGYSAVLSVTNYDVDMKYIEVDVSGGSDIYMHATNNFVVIPEPGTGSLLIFFLGMGLVGMPGLLKICARKEPHPGGGGQGGSYDSV
ncbi:MAG: hypothetical protein PHG65_05050 [Kiritimatiellae bacterium]|nr:hypothetical protein [Kiritimatiellia bacterium]